MVAEAVVFVVRGEAVEPYEVDYFAGCRHVEEEGERADYKAQAGASGSVMGMVDTDGNCSGGRNAPSVVAEVHIE